MSSSNFRALVVVVSAVFLGFLTGCEETTPNQTQYLGGVYGTGPVSAGAPQDTISYWDGDHAAGKPSIKIRLSEQRAYFYKSGQLVGVSQLSTGREGLNTPMGTYSITQKDPNHVSSKYGEGTRAQHLSITDGHRGWNRQPDGRLSALGTSPAMVRSCGGSSG